MIDCGAAATAAMIVWPDGRWTGLGFDGDRFLASAVHVGDATGSADQMLVGAAAWRHAVTVAEGFVAEPLAAGRTTVAVAGRDVETADLVAATLRRVAAEATALAGAIPGDVCLVVPAGWGPRRRTWMRQAAHRAGLGQPRLVEAPVAVAQLMLAAGEQVLVGQYVLVCDVGATFEATVLRRGPAGFEVLATQHDDAAGGSEVDRRLAAALTPIDRSVPTDPTGKVNGDDTPDGADGRRWAVVAAAHAAKEVLTRAATATVMLPTGPVVATSAVLDAAAQPVAATAAQRTVDTVAAAELTAGDLAHLWLVGGGAAAPWWAQQLTAVGLPVQVPPDPQTAAVRGAGDLDGQVIGGDAAAPHGPSWGSSPSTANIPIGTAADRAANPASGPAAGEEVELPPTRRIVGVVVPGVSSLALFAHCLLTAQWHNGSRVRQQPGFRIDINWGELALAAVFAAVAALSAGTLLAATLHAPTPSSLSSGGPARPLGRFAAGPAVPRAAAVRVASGVVAAAAIGAAVAGLYAVTAALFFGQPMGGFLRWAVGPVTPIVLIAAATAWVTVQFRRRPRHGWDDLLAFPSSGVIAVAAGMVVVQEAMTAARWPALVLTIDIAGRVGGLLIGVGVALILLRRAVHRVIVGALLGVFLAALTSWPATGMFGVIVAVAVSLWWLRRLWTVIRTPAAAVIG